MSHTNIADLEDLHTNPEWTKAVFFRDPATRFLSDSRSAGRDTADALQRAALAAELWMTMLHVCHFLRHR